MHTHLGIGVAPIVRHLHTARIRHECACSTYARPTRFNNHRNSWKLLCSACKCEKFRLTEAIMRSARKRHVEMCTRVSLMNRQISCETGTGKMELRDARQHIRFGRNLKYRRDNRLAVLNEHWPIGKWTKVTDTYEERKQREGRWTEYCQDTFPSKISRPNEFLCLCVHVAERERESGQSSKI